MRCRFCNLCSIGYQVCLVVALVLGQRHLHSTPYMMGHISVGSHRRILVVSKRSWESSATTNSDLTAAWMCDSSVIASALAF